MRTVNKVILIGNVAKDPLVREVNGGSSKNAMFVVATNRVFTDRNGDHQSEAEFSNCIAWGWLADRCEQFLTKGKLVYIEGRLKTRTQEREDGTRSYRTEIVVSNLIFLNKRNESAETVKHENAKKEEAVAATPAIADTSPDPLDAIDAELGIDNDSF